MNKPLNKNYRSYDYISRYQSVPYYYDKAEDKYIYGTAYQLKETDSFILHKVKYGDTFDTLALSYYNNPTLYWVICDFNRIQDPFTQLKVDDYIKIPTLSDIRFNIN